MSEGSGKFWDRSIRQILGFGNSSGTDRYTQPIQILGSGSFNFNSPTYEKVQGNEAEIFKTTGLLQVVINKKASMKSSGIWQHGRKLKDGTFEDFGETDYIKLLNNPNPLMTKDDFIKQIEINKSVYGVNFCNKWGDTSITKVPGALWNLQPEEIEIMTTGKLYEQFEIDGIIKGYRFNNGDKIYDPNEIFMSRINNIDNPVGIESPLEAIFMEISNLRGAMGLRNLVITKKGALGIISSNKKDVVGSADLDPEEQKEIDDAWQKSYGYGSNKSSMMIAKQPIQYTPISFPVSELMVHDEADASFRVFIDHYGLHNKLFSIKEGSKLSESGSGMVEAEKSVYKNTIIPEANNLSIGMTKLFNFNDDSECVRLNYDHVEALKKDTVTESKVIETKTKSFKNLVSNGVPIETALKLSGLEE